jgi:hypothetical protein
MTELLLFRVGAMQFGIDLPLISNIHSVKSSIVLQKEGGARLLRTESGEEMPLYDLSYLFEGDGFSHDSEDKKMIMLQVDEHPIGLIVDRVDQVVAVDNDGLEPLPPIFKGPAQACFPSVLKQEDLLVLLLSPEGIVKITQETIDTLESMDAPAAESVSNEIEQIERRAGAPADHATQASAPPNEGRTQDAVYCEAAHAAPELDIVPPPIEEVESREDPDPNGTAAMEGHLKSDSASIHGKEERIEKEATTPVNQAESGACFPPEPADALVEDITGYPQGKIFHEPIAGNCRIASAVAAMLPEEKLASMVERITRKIILQVKPAELARKIFEQALEGLLQQGDGKQRNNSVRTSAQPDLE